MGAMPLQHDDHYPDSDGEPMAETSTHWNVMVDTAQALRRSYADTPDVWVGSNLFLYYKERTPGIAPDVMAVRGVAKRERRTFKIWEEGHAPFFVLEVTSESTKTKDQITNKTIYAAIGVEEYFLYDPLGEYLKPRLQGFRLAARGYQPIPRTTDGSLSSTTTGLILRPEGPRLRLVNAGTGALFLWDEEIDAARRAAEERADRATAERRAAEERARTLEAELARLRGDKP